MNLGSEINHLSLTEAIEKLRNHYSGLLQGDDDKASAWFLNHDATHIVFGTVPFDIKGETLNDIWTIFGSTVTLREYVDFFKFTTTDKVFNAYGGKFKTLIALVPLVPKCVRVFIHTRKMTKKWPWHVTEAMLPKKIGDIRKEYNIKLI